MLDVGDDWNLLGVVEAAASWKVHDGELDLAMLEREGGE
jgi:hypothetical protein